MRAVFADTGYWQAMLNPRDDLHDIAIRVTRSIHPVHIVTSEMVLVEVLNQFSRGGVLRETASKMVAAIVRNPNVTVEPQTRDLFRRALEQFAKRLDKDWSVTDCASFLIMGDRGLQEALAHDHHFEQAGFKALLRDS